MYVNLYVYMYEFMLSFGV